MQHIKKKGKIDRRFVKPFPGKYNIIDLSRMLTYPRPAGSKMEKRYIRRFIDVVPGIKRDTFGNRYIVVGKKPTTLFASHTDTVHSKPTEYKWKIDKTEGKFKQIEISKKQKLQDVIVKGRWASGRQKDILGADDTTGNWLMLNLISEKKPGLYIFHRAEEIGREGSEWIAEHRPKMLKGIKRVISFDRKGYQDIITHQMGERTASDKFAKELAKRLGSGFKPDPTGSFTDSMSYAHLVPECTNISIGYKGAHSRAERQNLRFARHLYTKLRDVDFETLPVERKPEKPRKQLSWLCYPDETYNYYDYWQDKHYKQEEPLNKKQKEYKERLDTAEQRLQEYEDTRQQVKNLFGDRYLKDDPKKFDKVVPYDDTKEISRYEEEMRRRNEEDFDRQVREYIKRKKKEGVIE